MRPRANRHLGAVDALAATLKCATPYHKKAAAHYTQRSDLPVESMLLKRTEEESGTEF